MASTLRWTSADLEALPDDGKRYEIIDGELYVSKQPPFYHQLVCNRFGAALQNLCDESKTGRAAQAPGIIFAEDDDVAPDVVWISNQRLAAILGSDGKLHGAPELVIEYCLRVRRTNAAIVKPNSSYIPAVESASIGWLIGRSAQLKFTAASRPFSNSIALFTSKIR